MHDSADRKEPTTMKICVIWVMSEGEIWVHHAADAETVEHHNPEGFEDYYLKAIKEFGVDYVRKQNVVVPLDSVEKLFQVPEIDAGDGQDAEIANLIDSYLPKEKIKGIKAIRVKCNMGLRDAKILVDHYQDTGNIIWPDAPEWGMRRSS